MFHGMRNTSIHGTARSPEGAPSESQLLRELYHNVRVRLPASWQLELTADVVHGARRLDAAMSISAPDDTQATVLVEVRRQLDPRDAQQFVNQLQQGTSLDEASLVVAPFLGHRAREILTRAGISYADGTGNLRLVIDRPAVYIESTGAEVNPWRETRVLQSLRGPTAGRVVRALCDFRPPYGIRELATRTRTSPASIARVVALLEREALLTRGLFGEVADVKWPQLIRRWTNDYSMMKSNEMRTFLEPRGLDALMQRLPGFTQQRYAVTGSLAAATVAPIAPPRLAVLYTEDIEQAAETLMLRRADRGANVMLGQPFDPVVFDRTTTREGVVHVALSQAAADLLTSPGRGPQEGEELLRWMEYNEDAWRER